MTNSVDCFEKTDLFLLIGSNTTEQHPLIGSRIINRVKDAGVPLILVDPRSTRLSKFAERHLKLTPGTDTALLNGFMNVIIEAGLHDSKFIESRTEGFERLKETVAKYTPELVERITGVEKEEILEAAKSYASADSAMIIYCMGITQHTTGVDNVKSCANLAMLTGNVGRPGTGVNPLRGQNNVQGACDMGALPNVYSGYQKVDLPEVREKFEKAWNVELPEIPGITVTETIDKALEGEIKALYVLGENPMISDPDSNHVRKALENLEFLVVQDIFPTETALLADVVLPGASFAEKDGTFTSTERRIQRVRKAIEPLGDGKSDWAIVKELAKYYFEYPMDYRSPDDILREINELTPSYRGATPERLRNGFGLCWPCPEETHPGTPILHSGKFAGGAGKFHPADFIEPRELPDRKFNYLLMTGRMYFHFHTGSMTRRTSLLHREVPGCYVEISEKDARKENLSNGMEVRVKTRRGAISCKTLITPGIPEGMLFVPFHFSEAPANALTINAVDPAAKIPEYKVCAAAIQIENGRSQ